MSCVDKEVKSLQAVPSGSTQPKQGQVVVRQILDHTIHKHKRCICIPYLQGLAETDALNMQKKIGEQSAMISSTHILELSDLQRFCKTN